MRASSRARSATRSSPTHDTAVGETLGRRRDYATDAAPAGAGAAARHLRRIAAPRPTRRRWRCAGSTRPAERRRRSSRSRAASTAAPCSRCTPAHPPSKRDPFELPATRCTFAPFPVWRAPTAERAGGAGGLLRRGRRPATSARCSSGSATPRTTRCSPPRSRALAAVARRARRPGDYFCVHRRADAGRGRRSLRAPSASSARCACSPATTTTSLVFDEVQAGFGLGGSSPGTRSSACVELPRPARLPGRGHVRQARPGRRRDVAVRGSRADASAQRRRSSAAASTPTWCRPSTRPSASRSWSRPGSRSSRGLPAPGRRPARHGLRVRVRPADARPTSTAYLGQRFWRGAIVLRRRRRAPCATASARASWRARSTCCSRRSGARCRGSTRIPGAQPPAWEDPARRRGRSAAVRPDVPLSAPSAHAEASALLPAILDIEYQVYEPARRTPPRGHPRARIERPRGLDHGRRGRPSSAATRVAVRRVRDRLAARAGRRIVEGRDDDPMLGKHNTMYSVSITVAPSYQTTGLGRQLKELAAARGAAAPHGRRHAALPLRHRAQPRRPHGADDPPQPRCSARTSVSVLTGQYEDPEGQAIYYRIPLAPLAPEPAPAASCAAAGCTARAHRGRHRSRVRARAAVRRAARRRCARPRHTGLLYGPAVNKLTLMNYVTPAVVRALEWVDRARARACRTCT